MSEQNQFIYEFGPFRLNAQKRLLLRDGKIVPLKPKAFETLLALVEGSGNVLEKDDLMRRIWPDTVVEEGNLTFNISSLRKALGDDPRRHEYIVTVPGEGYRFVAGVRAGFDELEVRERTRISIEEESAMADYELPMAGSGSTSLATQASTIPAVRALTRKKAIHDHRSVRMVGGLLFVLLALGGIGFWRYKQSLGTVATARIPFQQTTIKRLTNLGNALQAALSSDGKLFVHSVVEKDGKHSLWLGHTEGGPPVLLRAPADVVYQYVSFAPDGSSLYFIANESYSSSGILYRMPVFGGVPEKIRENVRSDLAFAPDGKRIAFTRSDGTKRTSSLVVADIEGPSEAVVASRPLDEVFVSNTLAWSPDGAQIAVAAVSNESKKQEIFISRIADGSTKQLTTSAWAVVYATTWLKDGNGLIVAAKDKEGSLSHLWHVSSADGAVHPVVADLNSYHLRLSVPASSDAVLTVQYQYYSNIWVAPADDLEAAKQISFGSLGRVDGVRGFDWTPGGQIVYKAEADQNQTIWSMNAEGGNQKQLLPTGYTNSNLSVSSDGRYVVFESNRSGGSEVWRASMDGNDIRQLTTGGNNSEPHASPAGNWIIYKSRRDDLRALWRISIDGGEPRQLTERSASWPRVSPDGKWVACEYDTDTTNKLAIVSIEGGRPVKLFDVPRLANFSYGIRWTSDSMAVTYHDWANGIWKQTLQGGEPQRLEALPEEKMFGHGWSRDGRLFAFVRGVQIRDVVLIRDMK